MSFQKPGGVTYLWRVVTPSGLYFCMRKYKNFAVESTLDTMLRKIKNIPGYSEDDAYKAGYDYGYTGIASTTNCHFSFFSSDEKLKSWERGKKEGERDKKNEKEVETK